MKGLYFKRLFVNVAVLTIIWFMMTQVNSFAAMLSVYFPVFWIFVFFPAMVVNWRLGLGLTLLSGLFFEHQYPVFRGLMVPLFLFLFLFLYFRRSKMFDTKYSSLLGLASLTHLVLTLVLGLDSMQTVETRHLLMRGVQDWFVGQVFLLMLLPALWVVFSMMNDESQQPDIALGEE